MALFTYELKLDGSICQQHRGNREYYDATTPLTSIPDCQDIVTDEVKSLPARARKLREQRR